MSLINEALKKAQRERHEGAEPGAAGSETGGGLEKRARPRSANAMLLLSLGAMLLVALSIVVTALWITRPLSSSSAGKSVASAARSEAAPTPSLTLPLSIPPTLPPPPGAPRPGSDATPAAPEPAPAATGTDSKPAAIAQTPAKVPEASALPNPAAPLPVSDERVHQLVESLRVMGIRSSGDESKVLMNDRVYRVNDYVDRTLGVKLTKVAPDNLTFTDSSGATYVKYF